MYVPLVAEELIVTNEAVVSTILAAKYIASKFLGPETMSLVVACQFPPAVENLAALWCSALVYLVQCEMCLEVCLPLSIVPNFAAKMAISDTYKSSRRARVFESLPKA